MLTVPGDFKWKMHGIRNSPCGRTGHTMSIAGRYLCVFGGHTQETYHDDLHILDLTSLESSNSEWERVVPFSAGVPERRSNHTMVACGRDLYL